MANCGLNKGLAFNCSDKKEQAGGFQSTFYLFNKADLDKTVGIKGITYNAITGNVTDIAFLPTTGLYEFSIPKNTLNITLDATRTEGGYAIYPVKIGFQVVDTTMVQRATLETIANADDICAIVETTSGRFELMGLDFGLIMGGENQKVYGKTSSENSAANFSLMSEGELTRPKIIFDTDYSTTEALIQSKVII